MFPAKTLIPIAKTLLISLLGVLFMRWAELPLPWLLGPMLGCLIASLAGLKLIGLPFASNLMRTVLGVAVGASFSPEVVARLGDTVLSLAFVPFFIFTIGAVGYPYFRNFCGFDKATSFYAAMPGGLQDMLIFGQEAGGSARILSLVHATRVLVIVATLPLILSLGFEQDLSNPPGIPAQDLPISEGLIMIVVAIAGWRIAKWLGLFGASILGPLILALIASLTGVITHRPPAEAITAAQFFIGLGVGVNYVGITARELRYVVLAALGYTILIGGIAVIFGGIVILAGLAPAVEGMLAFSPGGQAEMAVLAIVAGVDVAFVVTHHLLRIVLVIIGAPLAFRFLR